MKMNQNIPTHDANNFESVFSTSQKHILARRLQLRLVLLRVKAAAKAQKVKNICKHKMSGSKLHISNKKYNTLHFA